MFEWKTLEKATQPDETSEKLHNTAPTRFSVGGKFPRFHGAGRENHGLGQPPRPRFSPEAAYGKEEGEG